MATELSLNFDLAHISKAQATNIGSIFLKALEYVLSEPDVLVGELDLLSSTHLAQLERWSGSYPTAVDECVHNMIAKKAREQPDAQAICSWDRDLSFSELEDLSSRLAVRMQAFGVKPGVMVPMCFEKSTLPTIALLAILKAGGAVVPMDPTHPASRLEVIARDIDAPFVLTSHIHAEFCRKFAENIEIISSESVDALPPSKQQIFPAASPTDAAFVMFTSGTTGKPKGIVIEHTGYCSAVRDHSRDMRMDGSLRTLQFVSFAFVVMIYEVVTTLICGGCVCVASDNERMNDLVGVINRTKANFAFLTPALLKTMSPDMVPTLKAFVPSGQAMPPGEVSRWSPRVRVVVSFGQSETNTSVVNPSLSEFGRRTIGFPCGSWCLIVDPGDHNRVLPIGCAGELLVAGPALAREILNDPGRTANIFVPCPSVLSNTKFNSAKRFCKTGDIARFNSDGSVYLCGRKDMRVKLRGMRIELGDIEHHLVRDQRIERAAVVMPESGRLASRLVCVLALANIPQPEGRSKSDVVLLGGKHRDTAVKELPSIRSELSDRVPAYMIPSTWMLVEMVPTVLSGKLDRGTIKKWLECVDEKTYRAIIETEEEDTESDSIIPTRTEEQLKRIWSTVLNIPEHDIQSNLPFLSLGGDSVLAMQVVAKCRQEHISITVQDILRERTIRGLAKRIGTAEISAGTPFALGPMQDWYLKIDPKCETHFTRRIFLESTVYVSPAKLNPSLDILTRRHSMLRTRMVRDAQRKWLQVVTEDVAESYKLQVHAAGSEVNDLAQGEAAEGLLDIQKGPIIAIDLFDMNNQSQAILVSVHRAAVDDSSLRILIAELEELLEAPQLPMGDDMGPLKSPLQSSRRDAPVSYTVDPSVLNYWGLSQDDNTWGNCQKDHFRIDPQLTSMLLGKNGGAFNTDPEEVLLAAALLSFCRIFPDHPLPSLFEEMSKQTSGLECTEVAKFDLAIRPDDDFVETIRRVKDQRRLRNSGLDTRALDYGAFVELMFGAGALMREKSIFRWRNDAAKTTEVAGHVMRDALFHVTYEMDLNGLIVSFEYNNITPRIPLVRRWIKECQELLRHGILRLAHCPPEFTKSDFPLLHFNDAAFNQFITGTLPRYGIQDPRYIEDAYPTAPIQQGMKLSQAREPELYSVCCFFQLEPITSEPADVLRLHGAWQSVVDRHPVLRTIFVEAQGQGDAFHQVVLKNVKARIRHIPIDHENAQATLTASIRPEHGPNQPPFLLTTCQTKSGNVLCRLDMSHTITDGFSMTVLLRDLSLAYDQKLPFGSGPKYSDYISYLQHRNITSAINYWKLYLGGLTPCLMQVEDHQKRGERALRTLAVTECRLDKLTACCSSFEATPFNVIQAAWGLTLRRYTGMESVCFGYLASGRDADIPGIQDAMGPFISMLICRLDLSGGIGVGNVLSKTHYDFISSLPHQHCSLAEIQHALGGSGGKLFNTAMTRDDGLLSESNEPSNLRRLQDWDPNEV